MISTREDISGENPSPGREGFTAPPALQEAWVWRLQWHFNGFNYEYLARQLKLPIFRLGLSREKLGEWNGLHRTITISERHILEHPWKSVLVTLRHEMAHQYVEEVLGLSGAPPHGEAFQRACHLLRVEPDRVAESKDLGALQESTAERDKILTRVKLLLALAKSPNEHEAANAMRMANKYLLKYNLDLVELNSPPRFSTRHLGKCSGRIQEYEYTLARILQDHFFVMVIWTCSYDAASDRQGRILEISGTPENLEIAAYVHLYVMNLLEPLWKAHRKSTSTQGGTKLQYFAGLLRGLEEKLDKQKKELKEEHGLVWLGDPLLREYYRYLHPRIRTTYGSGTTRGEHYHAGLRDGRQIQIHRGVSGEAVNRGRLLPGDG
jgi:hypothetical protein